MIVGVRFGDTETDHHVIQERGFGNRLGLGPEVSAGMENRFIPARLEDILVKQ
jgi:hypothetical protein